MVAAIVLDHQDLGNAKRLDATQIPALSPGVDIYDGSREDQVCGRIINIASTNAKTHVLIESSFEAVDHRQLRAISADGPELSVQSLPYPVRPEPIEK
jgi:hypothetical protein